MVGDRKVYPVSEFNAGVASWLAKLPRVWVEGEVTEVSGATELADRVCDPYRRRRRDDALGDDGTNGIREPRLAAQGGRTRARVRSARAI